MDSLVQALERSKAECREFSTLIIFFCKKVMVNGLGTSRCWAQCCDVGKNSSRVRRNIGLNVTTWKSQPLLNVVTLHLNVATLDTTSRRS